jgi:hypothetical protein
VLLDAAADRVLIGHRSARGWSVDASAARILNAGQDYKLLISLAATSVSVTVDDQAVVGFAFNGVVVDGGFGTMTRGGNASFDQFTLKTSDSRFRDASPEMLRAGAKATAAAPSDGVITQAQLAPIVAAATERWSAALGGSVAGAIGKVVFTVLDLKGDALAQTVGNVVVIDADAAGFGWFVDATPKDDKEFPTKSGNGELRAQAGSLALGRIDLLTVVMHELGHVLGFEHTAAGLAPDVMTGSLLPGLRRLPVAGATHVNLGGGPAPTSTSSSSSSTTPTIDSGQTTTISSGSEAPITSSSPAPEPALPGKRAGQK